MSELVELDGYLCTGTGNSEPDPGWLAEELAVLPSDNPVSDREGE